MQQFGVLYAVLAAALYAVNIPLAKLFLGEVSPLMLAAFLYIGSGVGMVIFGMVQTRLRPATDDEPFTKADLPYLIGMVILNASALAALMIGLVTASASNVSLLNNLEIVATAIFAMLFFKEKVPRRVWAAIMFVTVAGIILTFEGEGTLMFSTGSRLVILACVFWGLENNCTRVLSAKSPMKISILKGFFAGGIGLVVAFAAGESLPALSLMPGILFLGFVAYGLSIFFYITAQRYLGAAKTSTYYAVAPFIAAGLSLLIFQEIPTMQFLVALAIMTVGVYLASTSSH